MAISSNNKRIAKNTVMLYIRMMVLMVVSILTAGVALRVLGEVDYGINNVVGGIIVTFGWISSMISGAMGRYFALEMGRGDDKKLNQYFCLSILGFAFISIIVVVLAETVGLWFLNNKMTIPAERMRAAHWVYQMSILSFIFKLISAPYTAIIVNREKMNVYAWISILEVLLRLGYLYLLIIVPMDKLIFCAIFSAISIFIVSAVYVVYARVKFKECEYHYYWDKTMFKDMASYSGWSLFGAFAGVARNQGINILLNMFFNPIVNAARGIAFHINTALDQFVTSFSMAARPQIIKNYGAGEKANMMRLVYRTSLLCYYLMWILSLPVLFETPFILEVWLKNVPERAVLFTRLVLITSLIETISFPIMAAVSATGKIKYYQLITGGLLILNLPVAYMFLKLGFPPEVTMYIAIAIAVLSQIARIIFMKQLHEMSIREYSLKVLLRIFLVTIISFIPPFVVWRGMSVGWTRLILVTAISTITILIIAFTIGIDANDRKVVVETVKNKVSSIKNKIRK